MEPRPAAIQKSPRAWGWTVLQQRYSMVLTIHLFWLRDRSLEGSDDLSEPAVLAQEIVEDLQAALEQFAAVAAKLQD